MLFSPKQSGQGLVEYALILVLVIIVIVVVAKILGPALGDVINRFLEITNQQ